MKKKYWYHISTLLDKRGTFILDPWDSSKAKNRCPEEPEGKRIPVSPSIEQCLIAIPLYRGALVNIYKTKNKVDAQEPIDVYDSSITEEHWITEPTEFEYIGRLDTDDFINNDKIDYEVCCYDDVEESEKMLKIWKMVEIEKYIEK
jgi:hypothetical protein